MSVEIIKYAFVAGEVSPTLFGRSDLEKYDLGLAECHNFFVDYRGGISTRPGTQFIDYVQHDDQPTKYFPFRFAPNLANTYVILFGEGYIRFIQDGAYVLEGDVTVTGITAASPGVVTATAHGFSDGEWVYLSGVVGMTEVNGRLFEVSAATANTFELLDPFGDDFDTSAFTAYVSGGVANRVYTLDSPYAVADLAELRAHQTRDLLRLTHKDYSVKNLVRSGHTSWALSDETFGNGVTRPTGVTLAGDAAGSASVAATVTTVDQDGAESVAAEIGVVENIANYAVVEGSLKITWTPITDAAYYNVYRSLILTKNTHKITKAAQLGFLGQAYGPEFKDNNIIPDFTVTPPQHYNPFANGRILAINVTAGGTGYAKGDAVVVTDANGSGFVGFPIVNDAGAIVAVVVQNGGQDYTAPTVSFTTSAGTGATATASLGEADGNDPAVSTVFQQRQIYAATTNNPLTIYGSRVRKFSNFDTSQVITDGDSYEHQLDSEEVASIEHLIPMRLGLVVASKNGIWLLHGGEGLTVTPLQAVADRQNQTGCSSVPPLIIGTDILYIEGKSPTVRLLEYSELSKVYAGEDMSILSNHLFANRKNIVQWGYAQAPHNVVWAILSDGSFLSFTLVKEQNVFAWAPHSTRGLVKDTVVVQEDGQDVVYLMVQRKVNGRWTKFIERFASRTFRYVEDSWCVDCGLSLPHTFPTATLTPAAATGEAVVFTASAAVFSAGDVGSVIRGGGGKAEVVTFTDTTHVVCRIIREITDVIPEDEDDTPLPIESGDWTMDVPVTVVGGLHHLEGMTVKIVADGNVMNDAVVTDGEVTLEAAATNIVIGLGYTCRAKTLPPASTEAVIEGHRKDILGSAVRVFDTRGLKVGASLDDLYEMKERKLESYGEPIALQEGNRFILIDSPWDDAGQTFYVQEYPLPATILGLVTDLDVGDGTD